MTSAIDFDADDINVGTFWRLIGQRAIGTTVVTTRHEGVSTGFLGLSAAHVSAVPPRMLVSIGHGTSALPLILESGHFAINFLSSLHQELAERFSGKGKLPQAERFEAADWTMLKSGSPVLTGALASFDCRIEERLELPEVTILIARVEAATCNEEATPLVFFRGKYVEL